MMYGVYGCNERISLPQSGQQIVVEGWIENDRFPIVISAFLLLIGFAYLLLRKVITARIPLAYIGTVAVLTFLFPLGNDRIAWMAAQVFGGGLMLGAIFMATDYVTSPVTKLGQIVYGIGCGLLTVLIRYFGGYNEGVSYAILCMNACVVLLDRIGRPVKFGAPKKEAAK